jgi:hypothetical protein
MLVRPEEGAHFDGVFAFWVVSRCWGSAAVPAPPPSGAGAIVTVVTAGALLIFAGPPWRSMPTREGVDGASRKPALGGGAVAAAHQSRRDAPSGRQSRAGRDHRCGAGMPPGPMNVYPSLASNGRDLILEVAVQGDLTPAWGTAAIDFGDGPATSATVTPTVFRHIYRREGDYQVAVHWSGWRWAHRCRGAVHGAAPRRWPFLIGHARYPQSIAVRMCSSTGGVEMRCAVPAHDAQGMRVGLVRQRRTRFGGDVWNPRSIDGTARDPGSTCPDRAAALAGDLVRFSVGARRPPRQSRRSDVFRSIGPLNA